MVDGRFLVSRKWQSTGDLALLPTARAGVVAFDLVIEKFLMSISRPVEGSVQEVKKSGRASVQGDRLYVVVGKVGVRRCGVFYQR